MSTPTAIAPRAVGLGPQLGQPEQHAQEAISDGVEVPASIAKIGIVQPREDGSNVLQRARHGPLRREALLVDQPLCLAGELGAAQNHAVQVDELVTCAAGRRVELPVQPVELSLGVVDGGFETRQLGLAVVAQDRRSVIETGTSVRCAGPIAMPREAPTPRRRIMDQAWPRHLALPGIGLTRADRGGSKAVPDLGRHVELQPPHIPPSRHHLEQQRDQTGARHDVVATEVRQRQHGGIEIPARDVQGVEGQRQRLRNGLVHRPDHCGADRSAARPTLEANHCHCSAQHMPANTAKKPRTLIVSLVSRLKVGERAPRPIDGRHEADSQLPPDPSQLYRVFAPYGRPCSSARATEREARSVA